MQTLYHNLKIVRHHNDPNNIEENIITRIMLDGLTYRIMIQIDTDMVAAMVGAKAFWNKSRSSRCLNGAIKCKLVSSNARAEKPAL